MKKITLLPISFLAKSAFSVAVLLAVGPLASLHAATFSADFTQNPPYTVGTTIIGTDGWTKGTIDSGNNTDASIVASGTGQLLEILSTSTGTTTMRRTTVTNTFTAITANTIYASVDMGWNSLGTTATQTAGLSFGKTETNGPTSIQYSSTNGIVASINGSGQSVTLLAGADVKPGYLYDFNVVFHFDTKKFDIDMTGLDVNDQPVDVSFSNLAFVAPGISSLSSVLLFDLRGDNTQVLVSSINISTVPEPATLGLVMVGGALLVGRTLRRNKKFACL